MNFEPNQIKLQPDDNRNTLPRYTLDNIFVHQLKKHNITSKSKLFCNRHSRGKHAQYLTQKAFVDTQLKRTQQRLILIDPNLKNKI